MLIRLDQARTWLAVFLMDRRAGRLLARLPLVRALAARIVNADMAAATAEGRERDRRRLLAALDWPGPASMN
ncbi:MAG: hypothetical protein ACRDPP_00075 [Gaiellaceae bacterium]